MMGIYLFFVMFTSNLYILKCNVHTLNLDFVDGDVSTCLRSVHQHNVFLSGGRCSWNNYQTRVANRSDF